MRGGEALWTGARNYASFWIKQQMYRYVENCYSVIRISSGTRAEVLRYKKIYAEYKKQPSMDK